MNSLNGILVINKPLGVSSAGILNRAKRLLPRKNKIGHAGTLDPLASGVLVAMLGNCTKLCEQVMGLPKRYDATIQLGATSATDDAEGPITPTMSEDELSLKMKSIDRASIEKVLEKFIGTIDQTPPEFSAIKQGGRRACDLVREGKSVEMKSRKVRVDGIRIVELNLYGGTGVPPVISGSSLRLDTGGTPVPPERPTLRIEIDSGRGFYVRSLARDLGEALGVGGYLTKLIRTRVGPFWIENSIDIETATPETIVGALVDPLILNQPSPADSK